MKSAAYRAWLPAIFAAGVLSASLSFGADDAVVALVGEDAIRAPEVQRVINKVTRGRAADPAVVPFLQAQALEEIVARRLVLAHARRTAAADAEARLLAARAALKAKLTAQHRSIEDYLKAQSITEADLDRQLTWNAVWEKQLAAYATDARLESHFQSHRREFDGTELAVSHVLLRSSPGDGPKGVEALVKQAEAIRAEIAAGKISFAEAAKKYSGGPSGKEGGQLGAIGRHGPMDEAFSRAAFALSEGQVSPPVRTPFGVSLIRCDSVKPGSKPLAEVRKEVEDALARELLESLAQAEREFTPVKYTGAMPYFRPGTRDVVLPAK
jgi:parvulin-like peptidyl-prolyl isomerase